MPIVDLGPLVGNWSSGVGPLYKQLAERVAQLVREGDLRPNDRLPPERTLAQDLAVSRSTTVAAYSLLADNGVIVRRQGSGTRITAAGLVPPGARIDASDVSELFRPMLADDNDVIDLASAGIAPAAGVRAVLESLPGAELTALLDTTGYTPAGLPAFRRRVAQFYTEHELPTDAGQILATNGAQQAISLVTSLLVNPSDAVITEEATYGGTLDILKSAGARIFTARSDQDGVDVADLQRMVERVRPVLIYLVPTYHNPTGTVLTSRRRQQVVDLARAFRVPVIDDLTLAHLSVDGLRTPPPLAHYAETGPEHLRTDLVITVDSLAKVFWGGLRTGWLRAAPGLINRLVRAKTIIDLGSSPVLQLAAIRLLDQVDETRAARTVEIRAGLEYMIELLGVLLPQWRYTIPRGGQVLWIKLPRGCARNLAAVALRHGVRVATGPAFSPDHCFDDYLRLPFTLPRAALAEGVHRLASAWAAYDPEREPVSAIPLL
jgi:DNA-binding transcriptional MocR family regulator